MKKTLGVLLVLAGVLLVLAGLSVSAADLHATAHSSVSDIEPLCSVARAPKAIQKFFTVERFVPCKWLPLQQDI